MRADHGRIRSARRHDATRLPAARARRILLVALACLVAGVATARAEARPCHVGVPGCVESPPSDSLPVPVLLVPGWGDEPPQLAELRTLFIEAGWPPGRVVTMGFRDPVGSNRSHAREVGAELRNLRKVTGTDEVDVVAHSMGGLAVRHHLANTGGEGVRRAVFLATPHRGTIAAYLAWGEGSEEMVPGSAFLDSLNAGDPVPPGVEALAVEARLDLRIVPGESAQLPPADNVRNVEVCCPTHVGLLDHPDTFRAIVEFLTGGEPR